MAEELKDRLRLAQAGGGAEKIEQQHQAGKLTARERIELLLDPGTLVEFDALVVHQCRDFGLDKHRHPGDGIITGYGKVDGRPIYFFAQDFTVFGGSVSEAGARKICKVLDFAVENRAPVVSLNDGSGARIQEGIASLGGYAEIGWRIVRASGVIPQIAAIMGPCAGGTVYTPSACDFISMVDGTSYMFVTGPEVIKMATNEQVTQEELGGASTHFHKTGVAHFVARSDAECIQDIRRLLSYLPSSNAAAAPRGPADPDIHRPLPELAELIPADSNRTYDILNLINAVVDPGTFFEVQAGWARNLVVGFARIDGRSVGILANQPKYLAGTLDIDASLKGARFVRFCDAFDIPIITLLDTPGYLPGLRQELNGVIRHGAKLGFAYAEATTPQITIILRKAFGGAYGAMGSKHMRCDLNFALPTAEIAVMAPEGAAAILYRRELAAAGDRSSEIYQAKVQEFREKFSNPFVAAQLGYIDAVIEPGQIRSCLARGLEQLNGKLATPMLPRKHSNIPL
jgi:propionyl-CoA carboxylase beta chain